MNRITKVLSRTVFWLGAAILITMAAMVILDIVLRTVFYQTLGFVEEMAGYMVVALTFFGVSLTFREGEMFRVGFLFDKLPERLQRALGIVYLVVTIVFCTILMWFTALTVVSSFERGKIAATELQTQLYVPQLLLPVGFMVLLAFVVERLFRGETMGVSDTQSLRSNNPAGE